MTELKPCPFCGTAGDGLLIEHLEGTILRPAYRVACGNCGAASRYSDADYAAAWNTRAAEEGKAELAEFVRRFRGWREWSDHGEFPLERFLEWADDILARVRGEG